MAEEFPGGGKQVELSLKRLPTEKDCTYQLHRFMLYERFL
jgi:hypothetical protein